MLWLDPQWARPAVPEAPYPLYDPSGRREGVQASPRGVRAIPITTVRVHEVLRQCYGDDVDVVYEWVPTPKGYTYGGRTLGKDSIEALRALALSRPNATNLLAQVGIGRDQIAARREDILRAAGTPWDPTADLRTVPESLENLLSYGSVAAVLREHLEGRQRFIFLTFELEIQLPGDPPITIRSSGTSPWKLPWEVSDGEIAWNVNDIEFSRAVLPLLDPEGPNAGCVDGSDYWEEAVWHDSSLWHQHIGSKLDELDALEAARTLDGYERVMDSFQLDDAMLGNINSVEESLYVRVSARTPRLIEAACWWSPLVNDRPSATWHVFLDAHARATRCASDQAWLAEWLRAGRGRSLEMRAVGERCYSESMPELFIQPAWKDAGLAGAPEFEICLRRDGGYAGTIWLSSSDARCVITDANPDGGGHWFDSLSLSFHPNDTDVPTYGLVGANGKFKLRTLSR